MQIRSRYLLLVVALTLCGSDIRGAEEPAIDREAIVARLKAWKSSFTNLRVVWEMRGLPEGDTRGEEDWPPAPGPDEGHFFKRDEWVSAGPGLDLLDSRFFYWDPGSTAVRNIELLNLPKQVFVQVDYHRPSGQPERMQRLALRDMSMAKGYSGHSRTPLDGLYWASQACWLTEVLDEWSWNFVGIESVNGEPCARIELTEPPSKHLKTLWLDLQRDCLVRRIRGGDFIVDEFQQLEGRVWFPKRGRLQICSKDRVVRLYQSFIVTEVELNPTVDRSRFEIPAPEDGVSVDTFMASNFVNRGATEDPEEVTKDAPANWQKKGATAMPSEAEARWWLMSVGAIAGLLAVGLWLRRRG